MDWAGALYFSIMNQNMLALFGTIIIFEQERHVFLRELGDKTYSTLPYFISKSLIEIPYSFIFPILTSSLIYFAVGFEAEFLRFLFFAFTLCVLVVCSASLGMMLSAAFG